VALAIEGMVIDVSLQQPAFGQIRIANEIRKSGQGGGAFDVAASCPGYRPI
jgi:hypothetical protein